MLVYSLYKITTRASQTKTKSLFDVHPTKITKKITIKMPPMGADQELAAFLARRRSKITNNNEPSQKNIDHSVPVVSPFSSPQMMDERSDQNLRGSPSNSNIDTWPDSSDNAGQPTPRSSPPKLPFGLGSGKSLSSRKPKISSSSPRTTNVDRDVIPPTKSGEKFVRRNSWNNNSLSSQKPSFQAQHRPHSTTPDSQMEGSQNEDDNNDTGSLRSFRSGLKNRKKWGRPSLIVETEEDTHEQNQQHPSPTPPSSLSRNRVNMPSWVKPSNQERQESQEIQDRLEYTGEEERPKQPSWTKPTIEDTDDEPISSNIRNTVTSRSSPVSRDSLKNWKKKNPRNKQDFSNDPPTNVSSDNRPALQPWKKSSSAPKAAWKKPTTPSVNNVEQAISDNTESNDTMPKWNRKSTGNIWKQPVTPSSINDVMDPSPSSSMKGAWKKQSSGKSWNKPSVPSNDATEDESSTKKHSPPYRNWKKTTPSTYSKIGTKFESQNIEKASSSESSSTQLTQNTNRKEHTPADLEIQEKKSLESVPSVTSRKNASSGKGNFAAARMKLISQLNLKTEASTAVASSAVKENVFTRSSRNEVDVDDDDKGIASLSTNDHIHQSNIQNGSISKEDSTDDIIDEDPLYVKKPKSYKNKTKFDFSTVFSEKAPSFDSNPVATEKNDEMDEIPASPEGPQIIKEKSFPSFDDNDNFFESELFHDHNAEGFFSGSIENQSSSKSKSRDENIPPSREKNDLAPPLEERGPKIPKNPAKASFRGRERVQSHRRNTDPSPMPFDEAGGGNDTDADSISFEIRTRCIPEQGSPNKSSSSVFKEKGQPRWMANSDKHPLDSMSENSSFDVTPQKPSAPGENPVLGISNRPIDPSDPFVNSAEKYQKSKREIFDPIIPFDEEGDTYAFEREKFRSITNNPPPTSPEIMYHTPIANRKVLEADGQHQMPIITPEKEHEIGKHSSFSPVDNISMVSSARSLETENSKYREQIASLKESLKEKDVMIEHLTKIVEGFESKNNMEQASYHSNARSLPVEIVAPRVEGRHIISRESAPSFDENSERFHHTPVLPDDGQISIGSMSRSDAHSLGDLSNRRVDTQPTAKPTNGMLPGSTLSYRARQRRDRIRRVRSRRASTPTQSIIEHEVKKSPKTKKNHSSSSPKSTSKKENSPVPSKGRNKEVGVGTKLSRRAMAASSQRRFLC